MAHLAGMDHRAQGWPTLRSVPQPPYHSSKGGSVATSLTAVELQEPVTRHIRQDFARILASQTVADALESLRRDPPQGRILYLYVVDDAGRLEGVVPTRRLLLSTPEQTI